MTAIVLTITTAGRARLVDAALPGTAAVRIAQAGLTATAFVPNPAMVGLPGEFARISTVAGALVDASTISLVIRDDTLASYALRGFALYLADGTLFAIYGQPDPILEKASGSTALLAVDVRFVDIVDPNLTFVEAGFINPPATTEVSGVIELATATEATTGTDTIRAITPATLKSVINARFGANAASTFVRPLLAAVDGAAFRLGIGLGNAATKDQGPGNGLNADMVDGLHTSTLPIASAGGAWGAVPIINNAGVTDIGVALDFHAVAYNPGDYNVRLSLSGANLLVNGNIVWTIANDGSGSGLDADLLDGQDGSYYTNIPARLGYTPWHAGNDGSGSGLDADLLDGRDASSFANAAHSHVAADLAAAFASQLLGTNGYQVMPGGLILQWGRLRGNYTGEPSAAVVFPLPFPNACLNISGNVHLNFPTSSNRDHWLQTTGNPTTFGAVFQFQSDGNTTSDGLNWFAIGY